MGISDAVAWWEDWQLRILVLASLFVQWILFLSAGLRKLAIPSWFRFIIWLAYLGSDALAIYGLATLFSRQSRKDCTSGQGNSILEVLWAPVLLMHLGGQNVITAYNIEDNELWTRHVVTAVSQVTVAIYVFCKSWPGGDKRLLQAAILFFVPGILKCIDKPWALKSASINSLVSLSSPAPMKMANREGGINSLEDYVQKARSFVQVNPRHQAQHGDKVDLEADNHLPNKAQREDHTVDLEPNLEPQTSSTPRSHRNQEVDDYNVYLEAYKLFVDLALPSPDRLGILKSFWVLDEKQAYALVQNMLFSTFDFLYTKEKMLSFLLKRSGRQPRLLLLLSSYARISAGILPWAAIGLFHKSHREAYNGNDVKVTYALFCCTAVLDYFFLLPYILSAMTNWVLNQSLLVGQYALLGFFVHNKTHPKMVYILSSFNCKDLFYQHWSMKPCNSSFAIIELVVKYVKEGWESQIKDADSYLKFNDHRVRWSLQANKCDSAQGCSRRPFDESVLLWHIATDICFYHIGASTDHLCATDQCIQDTSSQGHKWAAWCERSHHGGAVLCREMSNYMIYLLFVNPEMLLSGTRRNLLMTANAELEAILKDDNPSLKKMLKGDRPSLKEILKCKEPFLKLFKGKKPSLKEVERGLMQRIIAKVQTTECKEEVVACTESAQDGKAYTTTQEGFIHDAWKISKELLALGDEKKMWEVIEGVWVEMLCFSASRSRGYLHAKSLGTGGQLLTYVWFLLERMGMETLSERLQRVEHSN